MEADILKTRGIPYAMNHNYKYHAKSD
uniref:Uncharacterized protein n=1 Tax=Rhizophora mucronata TaxID=61149 RepID=A0A2P2IQT4_RHIMU